MKRPLSAVELQVLADAARGETVGSTAARMRRSPATIKNHRQSILATLGVRNMAQAVDVAHRRGLLGELRSVEQITPGQVRAFHGKLGALAIHREVPTQVLKRQALDQTAAHVGRTITSTLELSSLEANWMLDELDEQLAAGHEVSVSEPTAAAV